MIVYSLPDEVFCVASACEVQFQIDEAGTPTTEQDRPALQFRVVAYPKSVHLYVGIPCPDGYIPKELIIPNGHFLTETLRSTWGAIDKTRRIRYRICVMDVVDTQDAERKISDKIETIKAEWKRLLDKAAHQFSNEV